MTALDIFLRFVSKLKIEDCFDELVDEVVAISILYTQMPEAYINCIKHFYAWRSDPDSHCLATVCVLYVKYLGVICSLINLLSFELSVFNLSESNFGKSCKRW